jgi:hypothetical protein
MKHTVVGADIAKNVDPTGASGPGPCPKRTSFAVFALSSTDSRKTYFSASNTTSAALSQQNPSFALSRVALW